MIRAQSIVPSRPPPYPTEVPRRDSSVADTFDYRALYQQSPFSILVFDLQGHVVMANDSFTRQWGITVDQIPDDYSILRDTQMEKAGIMPLVRRAFAGDEVVLPPLHYNAGKIANTLLSSKWFQGTLSPIYDADHTLLHVVNLHTDISEEIASQLAMEARGEREARCLRELIQNSLDFHAIYEQLPFTLVVYDLLGRVLMANLAFTQHWEITPDQFPADYSLLNDPELEAAGVLPSVQRAFAGEIVKLPPLRYDIGRVVHKQSATKWFQAVLYPVRDENGEQQQVVVLHTEVTEHIEAEAAREAQMVHEERRVREILESTTDGVILLDAQWRMTYLNKPAHDMVSSGRPLVGIHLWDAFPHVMNVNMVAQYGKSPQDRSIVEYEELFPEAGDKWLHIRAFPTAEGTAIFFQDMTARRLSEKAHRENEKLVVVGRLAASIAHEINNPLESVANLLFLLQGEHGMSESALRFVDLAQQELRRVAIITINTLKFFRQSTAVSEASMLEIVGSVLTLFQGHVRHSDVNIVTRYRAHQPFICYSAELRQIFANFIANALDATGSGGRIYLRVRPTSTARPGEPGIVVTIADNGMGMSPHTLAHIYDAFFTTKEITGTGLGLWVSSELIRKHSGRIRVRSRQATASADRSGTVFQIIFPYNNHLSAETSADAVEPAPAA
jgi:signal transduction histidine kinase